MSVHGGRRIRVSTHGGTQPLWRGDQRELYYLTAADEIVAVSIESDGNGLSVGEPRVLFEAPIVGFNRHYDVTSDGQRFLITTGEPYHPTKATVLLNWFTSQRGRVRN